MNILEDSNHLPLLRIASIFESMSTPVLLCDVSGKLLLYNSKAKDFFLEERNSLLTPGKSIFKYIKDPGFNYSYLFQNNPLPLFIFDVKTFKFLEVNNAAIMHYGYSREEFLAMTILDIRPTEDVAKLMEIFNERKPVDTFYNGIWHHKLKNNQIILVEITSYRIDYNGVDASLVLAVDRTQQLKAIEQNEFEKRDKEAIINATDDLIWSVNRNMLLITANQAFVRNLEHLTGLVVKPGDSLVSAELPEALVNFWKETYHKSLSGQTFKEEFFTPETNNSKGEWSETIFNPIYDGISIIGIACYSRNITERKLVEQQLRDSEAHLAEAQRLAKLGSWNFDFKSDRLTWSDQLYDVFGTDKDTFTETHNSFIDLVDEQDRDRVKATSVHTQQTGEPFTIEYRITTPTGEKRIIQEHGYGEKDADNSITRLFGTAQDITEIKKIQQQLILSEQQLAVIYNTVKESLFMVCRKENGRFSFNSVNKAFLETLRLKASDVIGKYADEIIPPETWKIMERYFQKALRTKKTIQWEESSSYYGGKMVGLVSITPVDDPLGKCDLIVGSVNDITESKKAAALIMESEKRYRSLFEQNLAGFYQSTLQGTIINCNDAFAKMLKYDSAADLLSTDASDLYFYAEDRNHFISSAILEKQLFNYEGVLKCKDGSKLYFIENISLRKDTLTGEEYCDGIILDVTQKKLLEEKVEVETRLKQKEITDAVFQAQEKERSEIGRELHDNINQILGATLLYIDMSATNEAKRGELLASASKYTGKAIDEIRNLSKSLITPVIEGNGLKESIKNLIAQIVKVNTVKIEFSIKHFTDNNFTDKFRINLFRIVQEQLNNILKHAKAKKVILNLEESVTDLILEIVDDGIGYDTAHRGNGVGITNIKSRIELYNGTLVISSKKNLGTGLYIHFKKELI